MTGRLPYALPFAQQLVVVDYLTRTKTTEPTVVGEEEGATGRCEATIEAVPPDQFWLVDRMTVTCTSSTETEARVYRGEERDANLVDGTVAGNLDIADEAQPILVEAGEELRCVWTGASDGAVGTFTVQVRVVERRGTYAPG